MEWIIELTIILIFLVSEEELRRLGKRFKKLDVDKNGFISVDEFMSLPELQQNPLVRRVIDLFDTDRNGEIDFKGWFQKFVSLIKGTNVVRYQNHIFNIL